MPLIGSDREVLGHLRQMFPQLSLETLEYSILHTSNRAEPFDEFILLQRCIDDLLDLRTYKLLTASKDVAGNQTGPALPPGAVRRHGPVLGAGNPPPAPAHMHGGPAITFGTTPGFQPGTPRPGNAGMIPTFFPGPQPNTAPGIMPGAGSGFGAFGPGSRAEPTFVPGLGPEVRPEPRPTQAVGSGSGPATVPQNKPLDLSPMKSPSKTNAHTPTWRDRLQNLESTFNSSVVTINSSQGSSCSEDSFHDNNDSAVMYVGHFPAGVNHTPRDRTKDYQTHDENQNNQKFHDFTRDIQMGQGSRNQTIITDRTTINLNFGPVPHSTVTFPNTAALAGSRGTPGNMDGSGDCVMPKVQEPLPGAPDVIIGEVVQPVSSGVNAAPKPEPPKPKTPEELLDERTDNICNLFPLADPTFVRQQLRFAVHQDPETVVCNYLLENPTYPKKPAPKKPEKKVSQTTTPSTGTATDSSITKKSPTSTKDSPVAPTEITKDYYKDYASSTSFEYQAQAINFLKNEFVKISMNDIRNMFKLHNNHYAPTRKAFLDAIKADGKANIDLHQRSMVNTAKGEQLKILQSNIRVTYTPNAEPMCAAVKIDGQESPHQFRFRFLKCGRQKIWVGEPLHKELEEEMRFILQDHQKAVEESDHKVAEELNEDEYQAEGQTIECGCCYGDWPFDVMVQCYEGHLFCQTCLQAYVKEAVYGQGKCKLTCLTDSCEAGFPRSELLRVVPSTVMEKYDEKQQEQSLNMADMSDLVRCPHCDFAAVLDPSVRVFKCQNTECLKETCRHCKENWEEHFGIPCSEMEKRDETKLRLKFEEKMTLAKVRQCHKCKASFTKNDGCNKMTCPCGSKMCYICRKPNIDYNHFCNHVRDPGKKCMKCTACSLWTNPEEDDERAVREIQKEAKVARMAEGFSDDRVIGVPEDQPKAKKPRLH